MELDPGQVAIVGIVASLLVILLRFLVEKAQWNFLRGKFAVTVVLAVVSFGLAAVFMKPVLPPIGDDFFAFLGGLLGVITAIMGVATAIYNLLFAYVIEQLPGWIEQVQAKIAG